jgi:preprotein translocase subunit SecA
MNQQRKVIYAERLRILEGENLKEQAHGMLVDVITAYVDGATAEGYAEDWDLEKLWEALKTLYPVGIEHETLTRHDSDSDRDELTREELLDALIEDAEKAYATREAELEEMAGEGAMRQLERNVLLNVIDRKWREHLYEMDYLKEGIGLRAMAQRDPLVEYQREGYDMFTAMLEGMKEESVGFLFNVTVETVPSPQVAPVEQPEGLADFATAAAAPSPAPVADDEPSAPEEAPKETPKEAPSTLRAKGIDNDESPALTYSGPSEDGSAQVQRNGGGASRTPAGVGGGGSRRERRAAARQQGRGAKPPKSVKKR